MMSAGVVGQNVKLRKLTKLSAPLLALVTAHRFVEDNFAPACMNSVST